MIKKYKNMNLKAKATIGFVVVFLIMLLSAIVGLLGLIDNSRKFNVFNELSEQAQLSNEIDSYLYAERLAFKKYETGNNIEFVNQYKEIDVNMKKTIDRLLEISKDKERIDYVQQITLKSGEYQSGFDTYILLANNISANYKELIDYGIELTEALTIINVTAQRMNSFETSSIVSDARNHLLTARLGESKYFDLHEQNEYNSYVANYKLFEEDVNLLKGIEKNIDYKTEYYTLVKYIPLYKAKMELLRHDIEKLDKIKSEMDSIGPEISALTAKIKESALDAESTIKVQTVASNQRSSIFVSVIFLIAVTFGSIVVIGILKLVLNPINFLKDTFESIASNDANTDFRLPETSNDEIGNMSKAFNIFMLKIKAMIEDIRYQNLLKTAETDMSEITRLEDDLNIITDKIVSYLCKNFNFLMGAIYIPNEDLVFQLSASYAYTNRKGIGSTVEAGLGVIGQVIKEKKMYMINELPDDYILVQSGLGDAKPNSVIVIPCLSGGELYGIIELASFEDFQVNQISMLEALSEVLGRLLSTVKARHHMKNLFDKTLKQSETLQIQQEELRQINEELEEQARALKESEGRLQIQQEELRITNEELQTYSKQIEEQKHVLKEKNNALEITQEEMARKAEALEKANKYKSEFLANMSHELRTPLNSILVLSQLLASKESDEPLSDKEKEFASTIHSSGKDLLTLINGVLDLSKFEAGKLEVNNEKIYLKEIVTENRNMFESMAEIKKLDFMISIDDGMPEYIITDSLRLNQIIKNLISNSIKFTHEGHVSVLLRNLNNKEKSLIIHPNDYIVIEVTDTGIGIPKEKQKEVFEAFKQSDGTTSRQYGGTGLGLTISLELAKHLGGDILLESEVNKGSEFLLIIPKNANMDKRQSDIMSAIEMMDNYDVTDKNANESKEKDYDDDTIIPTEGNKKRILIIEDDPTFAQILSDIAEEKGYVVTKSYTGKDGIRKAKSERPTGIILDIGLPDMDGLILAKMLSEDETTKNIPIHVISGSEDISEGDGFKGMPKSIIGFLKKPVDIKSIYKTLSKIENVDSKGRKRILVVGPCGDEDFDKFTQLGQVEIHKVLTGREAIEELKVQSYGCIILDIKLSDTNGIDFMTKLRQELDIQTPIIIYTQEEINSDEVDGINKYAETIILKSPKSKDRLMNEVSLFLHDVERSFSEKLPVDRIILDDKNSLVGVRVLLADDDSRNVFALMHLLEQNGMQVIVAKDGFEAVKQFEGNEVDLVLMDIMMPKIDGYEAIRQIRETMKGKSTPIIALTAKAMNDDRNKCISVGANDYLTKPVDAGRLLSMIKVWMS